MTGLQTNCFQKGGQCVCLCNYNSPVTVPSFIGNDYFCESGSPGHWQHNIYTDPLWDGQQCGLIDKACCQVLPWFNKTLISSTTDYIEMRVCEDQPADDEDSHCLLVGCYEIYVK